MTDLCVYLIFSAVLYIMALVSFLVGMRFGQIKPRNDPKETPHSVKHDDDSLRRANRIRQETMNMLTYDGSPQEEIEDR